MSSEYAQLMAKKLAKLPDDELKEHICNFLKEQTMCTLATSLGDIPRATPLEYWPEGMTLYIFADPGGKIRNIQANANVAIGIYNVLRPVWSGDAWKYIKAAQITGEATLLEPDDPENIRAVKEVIPWQPYSAALGGDLSKAPRGWIIKVVPKEIRYHENALMLEGYSALQIWQAST